MVSKKIKITKKKEDLPSFLLRTTEIPEDISLPPKTTKNVQHSGPVFFGCFENQPTFHNLNLGLSQEIHKTASSTENILCDIFLSEQPVKKCLKVKKNVYLLRKTQALFSDPYPHKCPGQRRIFVPESPPPIDLGETESVIEGEASREIPVFCMRETPDGSLEETEMIELSDIWEKKRVYFSSLERKAHTHFAKEFVTLEIIGPTIPAPITITKLYSKRKTKYEIGFDLEQKPEKKEGGVKTKKLTESKKEETESFSTAEVISHIEEEKLEEEEEINGEENKESETNELSDHSEVHSEENISEINEEADAKEVETVDGENDVKVVENEEAEELPIEEE